METLFADIAKIWSDVKYYVEFTLIILVLSVVGIYCIINVLAAHIYERILNE